MSIINNHGVIRTVEGWVLCTLRFELISIHPTRKAAFTAARAL